MKFHRTKMFAGSTLVLALMFVFGMFTNGARAQGTGDMPYDLHFIDMMITHHQEGLEMAGMVEAKSKDARLKAFAEKLKADQQKDIQELKGHRNQLYAGKPMMTPDALHSAMQGMHSDMSMDMEDTRRKLHASVGATFDRLFLDIMIHHHEMAHGMAKEATTKANHTAIKEFARKAAVKQQSQIAEMNQLKAPRINKTTKPRSKPKSKAAPAHKHGH